MSIPVFADGLTAVNLRTEYKVNPVTDATVPRLSWELTSDKRNQMQSSYQILVASSPSLLIEDKTDLWNSGQIKSRTTSQVQYSGKPLISRQLCYWKVRSWNQDGIAGLWSAVSTFEIGLISKDQWSAQWIGLDLDNLGKGKTYHLPPAPYLRNEIKIKTGVKKARLYVTALGLYEFSINQWQKDRDGFSYSWLDRLQ